MGRQRNKMLTLSVQASARAVMQVLLLLPSSFSPGLIIPYLPLENGHFGD